MSIDGTYSVAMVAACRFPANYGTPGAIREMSVTLAEMGHRVHVVTYPDGDDLPLGGVQVHRTGRRNPRKTARVGPSLEKPWLDLQLVRELCRVIREQEIEIIHAHAYEGALVGALAKFFTGRPLLYHAVNLMRDELHTYRFIRPAFLANALAWFLDWLVPRLADRIIAVSPELADALMLLGIPRERIDIVPCGIEPSMFCAADGGRIRARYGLGTRPVVLYTGVLNAFQRVDYLLEAFAMTREQAPEAMLLILSPLEDEPGLPACQALARKLGLEECVIWAGPHTLQELPDFLACATVATVPRCDCPGHPIKLLNYMMAGKPVVCFAGAAKGLSHERDGWVVPDHDLPAFAAGILRLLREPALAAALGTAARQTVMERFDWAMLCERMVEIYGEMIPSAEAAREAGFAKKSPSEACDSL